MKRLLLLLLLIPLFVWALPSEQDRSILEKGNRELLSNPGFEGRLSGWTKTGASTLTLESVAPANGKLHGIWTASAAGEFLQSEAITVPVKLQGKNKCSASLDYKWAGVQGELKLQIYDGSSVIAETELSPSPTLWANQPIQVTCPTSGTIQWRIESTAASAALHLDDAHLGEMESIDVSQTELVAFASYLGDASCIWALDSATFSDFPATAACNAITVSSSTQDVNTADDNLPNLVFDNLKAGKYLVTATVPLSNSVTEVQQKNIRITDSSSTTAIIANSPGCVTAHASSGSGDVVTVKCSAVFEYTSSGARNFRIQGKENGSGSMTIANNDGTSGRELTWEVVKYPTEVSEAITLETSGFHVDVNIGGSNFNMGTGNVPAYTELIDASMDMVVNPGSASAEIPCSGVNPSTGLTCAAGSESFGVVFDAPTAGRYKVCSSFSHFGNTPPTGTIDATFRWFETPNNALTILQSGAEKPHDSIFNNSSELVPFNNCSSFTFNSTGKKTLRMFYTQAFAVAAPSASVVAADRSAANGYRDIHITVEKMDEQKPTPVFTDLQDALNEKMSSGENGIVMYGAVISDTAVCSVFSTMGGAWISSITDNGTGDCTVNFAGGFFDGVTQPLCTFTTTTNSGFIISGSASNYRMQAVNIAGAQSNFAGAHLICIGKK